MFCGVSNTGWATTWGDGNVIEEGTRRIGATVWRWIFNDEFMTIRIVGSEEEFSILVVPDDGFFISDRDIFSDLDSVEPNSEDVGFVSWSTRGGVVDLIQYVGVKSIDGLFDTFYILNCSKFQILVSVSGSTVHIINFNFSFSWLPITNTSFSFHVAIGELW